MTAAKTGYNVLISSYIEPEHVDRIRAVDNRLNVLYEPELLPPPRYAADHTGKSVDRSADQDARWRKLLGEAEILFDFDHTHREDLPELAPNVRWIQATSAGIGQFVNRMNYDTRMPNTIFTTARGVHAKPLAEFCLMAMLAFNKGLVRMMRDQARKHWERYAGTDLVGRTVVIIGVGVVGREVARLAQAAGMSVVGIKRDVKGIDLPSIHVDELHPREDLHAVLERAEHLVLIAPHTPETERMIGPEELGLLPRGAILINIGRGALVDESALIQALNSGHLGGAALDVFAEEPLPPDSPLWEMQNVLVSPHSASTSDRENARLTDLFCDNLRRFLAGEPLRNVLDTKKFY
ncbi:MAG: D-2-hydroxyacid dehydrogenase [Gemmatimonadales bacterium]